ncbi:MAG: transglycosylase domain-containing protein, partial [Bacilli bacterium]|nr:transglycosylase domain-containing protein [Bacilli bacterium]
KKRKRKKKTAHKILIILLFFAIAIVSLILAGAIFIIVSAPEFDTDLLYNKEATVLVYNDDTEFARLGTENRDFVSYDELPQVLVDAIVATEDARFFQHEGFDIARFLMASMGQITGISGAGGASTLTMQVVKNTYTSTESHGVEGIIRKFTDIYMSIFKVEKKYTKEEIIEFYVNAPYLGARSYGVEQASQTYFGKSVRDLSLPEAALIAGIFNAPYTLNPFYSIENATARRNTVLDLMYRHGYISEDDLNDAKSISVESLITQRKGESLNKYQSFIDTVVEEVIDDTGLNPYNTPMKIQTTIDPSVQDVLNDLNNGNLGYKFINDVIQVAIVITDVHDGSIVAVNGRRNQTGERQLNLATSKDSHFQPGSTAKPIFAYGPAIEYNNASTGTYFFDYNYTYSNGTAFFDSDRGWKGVQTMREALSQSRNIPAVQAFQTVDLSKISEFVHSLGIDYGKELYESYAIGGGVYVNPLQMAGAYGAFARGGYYIEPYSYTKITFKDSGDVLDKKPKREKVMSEETAYMINSMLMTAQQQGAGGNFSISGTDVAAKTGTSTYDSATLKKYNVPLSTSADNWNITYSPDYVISQWYGYEKLSHDYYTDPIKAHYARLQIMSAVAKKVYKKNSRFTVPSGIARVEIERETVPLQLPSAYTPSSMRKTELFKAGTEPSEVSTRYEKLENASNGRSTISDNSINLSWDPAPTPSAINQDELKEHFKKDNYFSDSIANRMYERRIKYNNENIGTLGYNVYLENNGKETFIGYTNNTSYTYNTNGNGGNYKFVIKTAYSIFKDNMSNGIIINVSAGSNPNTNEITYNIGSVVLNGGNKVTEKVFDGAGGVTYNDPGLTIKDTNGNIITKINVTKTIVNTDTNEVIKDIDLTQAGTYTITYKIDGYDKDVTRTVIVK